MNEGYIYILVNPSLQKDMLKIGMTQRTPEIRAQELSSSTGIPSDFSVAYEEQVSNCVLAEKLLHDKLNVYRVRDNREFFQMPLKDAILALSEIANQIKISIPISSVEPTAPFASKVAIFDGHTQSIMSLAFSPDSKQLLSGAENANVILHDLESGEVIHSLHMHMGWVYCVDISPNGQLMLAGRTTNTHEETGFYDKTIYLWDLNSGELVNRFEQSEAAFSLSFSPNSNKVYSGTGRILSFTKFMGKVNIFDIYSVKAIGSLDGHSHYVNSITISIDGRLLASGSNDKTVRVWNLDNKNELIRHENHTKEVRSVMFSPDSSIVVSGGFDKKIIIWKWTENKISSLHGHTDYVRSVVITPDGKYIISGGDDSYIRFWEISSGKEIGRIFRPEEPFNQLAISKDGRYIASGDRSGMIHLWEIKFP